MKTKPPSFRRDFKLTVAQRLSELSIIDDIDEMLRDGISTGDVAKFIQLGLEELLDVKVNTLGKVLGQRRKDIMPVKSNVLDDRLSAIIPVEGRGVAQLSRNQHVVINKAMDRLVELEALYLAQRDRIDTMIEKEKDLGFPFEMTGREFIVAMKALELHGKQEKELLERIGTGPSHEKLDIEGYSKETSEVLRRPASRRRIISIVERLKRVEGGMDIPELPEASGE